MKIVKMNEIENVSKVTVDNQVYFLGEHRDFRRNEYLAKFIPENARLSMSWTMLKENEVLEIHEHPTPSMIIVYSGNGKVIGDLEASLTQGDIVAVPSGYKHGFVGGEQSLCAISVQFEGNGLYEDKNNARVNFSNSSGLDKLLEYNSLRLNKHVDIPFFKMLTDGTLEEPAKKRKFESLLKSWSRKFQSIIHLRQGGTQNVEFYDVFKQHLLEEIGHDDLIKATGDNIWDPVIESCSDWFLSNMLFQDNIHKAAIVHLVLENSAHEFHELAHSLLDSGKNDEYYETHAVHDEDHSNMVNHLLLDQPHSTYLELQESIKHAWDILEAMLDRMHKIITDSWAIAK